MQRLNIAWNLRNEQSSLDLLQIFSFLRAELAAFLCELLNVFIVVLLTEWELLYVHDHFFHGLRQAQDSLHERWRRVEYIYRSFWFIGHRRIFQHHHVFFLILRVCISLYRLSLLNQSLGVTGRPGLRSLLAILGRSLLLLAKPTSTSRCFLYNFLICHINFRIIFTF